MGGVVGVVAVCVGAAGSLIAASCISLCAYVQEGESKHVCRSAYLHVLCMCKGVYAH